MSNLEFCIARRKAEEAAFVKVLKAVPEARSDYRPDPKSRTAAELAWMIAYEEGALVTLLDTGSVEWKETPPPATVAASVAAYEENVSAVDERLAKLDGKAWEKTVKFIMAGSPPWEDTLANFFWGFLFDQVHHRGQLSVYLRPMGSKVPSIYGPSADDSGQ